MKRKETVQEYSSSTVEKRKKIVAENPIIPTSNYNYDDLPQLLISKGFTVEYLDAESWIAYMPNYFPPSDGQFDSVWNEHPTEYKSIKIFGKDQYIPRYQQSYGHSYRYSGMISESIPETVLITLLKDKLNKLLGFDEESHGFNMCLCNWYEPQHYIGPHSDDTRQLYPQSPIASISWGCTRTFVLKAKAKKGSKVISKQIQLQNGDLVIMGANCQETHRHEILKLRASEATGNRINFTFRCFK